MALTRDQALQEVTARRLSLRHVAGAGWVCDREDRRVRSAPGATPELAVEAAVALLAAREVEAAERSARQVVEEQQHGTHFHRPRQVSGADPVTGERVTRVVFDVFVADGVGPVVSGAGSVIDAWARLRSASAPVAGEEVGGGGSGSGGGRPRER